MIKGTDEQNICFRQRPVGLVLLQVIRIHHRLIKPAPPDNCLKYKQGSKEKKK